MNKSSSNKSPPGAPLYGVIAFLFTAALLCVNGFATKAASANGGVEFSGQPTANDNGLSYVSAHGYGHDPVTGRFMAIDPAPVSLKNSHSFNRYAYANNNPYRYIDPNGESPLDIGFLIWDK